MTLWKFAAATYDMAIILAVMARPEGWLFILAAAIGGSIFTHGYIRHIEEDYGL